MRSIICLFVVVGVFELLFTVSRTHGTVTNSPDLHLDTPGLIRARGFNYETHKIITADGYHLTLFRIINPYQRTPTSSGRVQPRPVLLWHGIGVDSSSWLFSSEGQLNSTGVYSESNGLDNRCQDGATNTLGFTLASCEFDVWLGNSRGSPTSRGHDRYDADWGKYVYITRKIMV